jgi:integrase
MHQSKPLLSVNPFAGDTHATMADLIAMITADADLTPVRRRNVSSSVRRFCKALMFEPMQVPANAWYFRERLKRFHPLQAGIKKKRWQTIVSDVTFALRRYGFTGKARGHAPLTAAWEELKQHLEPQQLGWGMSKLGHYCSAAGIDPQRVTDNVLRGFADAFRQESFKSNPHRLLRELCRRWNQAVRTFPQLNLQPVTLPIGRAAVTPKWEELAPTLRTEAERWLIAMSQEADDLFAEGPVKPLRPASIKSYRYAIRQAVAALAAHDIPVNEVRDLVTLVTGDGPAKILEFHRKRTGAKASSMLHSIAHVLVLVATHACGCEPAMIERLKRARQKLFPKRDGLRPRPKAALRPFADRANIERILCLPLEIYDRLKRKDNQLSRKDALLMQVALALELLLMRPIRRANLVALQLETNIIRTKAGMFVNIPDTQVKNRMELDYKLPRESGEMLEFYVKRLSPLFGANPNGWLFPGEDGLRPKAGACLGRQFTKTIKELTGLHLYPHILRHFGALLYLKEHPGAFEVVRRVLAHKSLSTTTRSYVDFADQDAVRLYDETVLGIRDLVAREVQDAGE